jgi:flagellar protein FlaG
MAIDRISSNRVSSISTALNENPLQRNQPNIEKKEEQSNQTQQHVRKVSKDYLEKTIRGVNEFLLPVRTSSKFQFHEQLGEFYVQVVNDQTKEVIREIPSKEFLDMYAAMKDLLGLVVDEKV